MPEILLNNMHNNKCLAKFCHGLAGGV